MTTELFKKIINPILVFGVLTTTMIFSDRALTMMGTDLWPLVISIVFYSLEIGLWLVSAWLVIRLTNLIMFDIIISNKLKAPVPRLLKDVFATIILVTAISGILSKVFDLSVAGILAATGAIGIVVGFALKDMIADVFSGIAINIERPFVLGDVIECENGSIGTVCDISWRTTSILAIDGIMAFIPNGRLSTMQIKNYSKPEASFRLYIDIHIDHNIPSKRVLRILNASVKSSCLNELSQMSNAHIADIDKLGVKYRIYFWLPEFTVYLEVRTKVLGQILESLYHSGINIVHPKLDVYSADLNHRRLDIDQKNRLLLSRVLLFKSLGKDELSTLSKLVDLVEFKCGDTVVQQGEEGDSLFLLVEGLLDVMIRKEDTDCEVVVGQILPGNTFGEFSLLTREVRMATVKCVTESILFEVHRDDLAVILRERPELAEELALMLAQRQILSEENISEFEARKRLAESQARSNSILSKMMNVFSFLSKD
jgi:small-conductance mechanosensitive channel/CRP-like cAMP-binding protein